MKCLTPIRKSADRRSTSEKEWYEIEGGHFGLLYHPSDLFHEASSVQADFLRSHLTAKA